MPITKSTASIITTVQSVTVTLKDQLATNDDPASKSINYQLVLLDQFGRRMRDANDQGSLVPHMAELPYTLAQMQAFVTAVRDLAEEILL